MSLERRDGLDYDNFPFLPPEILVEIYEFSPTFSQIVLRVTAKMFGEHEKCKMRVHGWRHPRRLTKSQLGLEIGSVASPDLVDMIINQNFLRIWPRVYSRLAIPSLSQYNFILGAFVGNNLSVLEALESQEFVYTALYMARYSNMYEPIERCIVKSGNIQAIKNFESRGVEIKNLFLFKYALDLNSLEMINECAKRNGPTAELDDSMVNMANIFRNQYWKDINLDLKLY